MTEPAESTEPVVLVEQRSGVGVLTLNRPARRNALHPDMYPILHRALDRFESDSGVGCVVLTGAGTGFCAGGDVRDGRRRGTDDQPSIEAATASLLADARIAQRLHELDTITLAAVNGPAVGAGLSLALACDLRILSRSATLIPGWGRLAFSGDFGGTWFLTRLLGPSRALDVLTANTTITADLARDWGLANRVAEDDSFAAAWSDWASALAAGPSETFSLMKQNVTQAATAPLSSALPAETERMVRSGRTADHTEAVRAWLQKRDPVFGRTSAGGPDDGRSDQITR